MPYILPVAGESTPPAHFCRSEESPEIVSSSAVWAAGSRISTEREPAGMKYSRSLSAATAPLHFITPEPPAMPAKVAVSCASSHAAHSAPANGCPGTAHAQSPPP